MPVHVSEEMVFLSRFRSTRPRSDPVLAAGLDWAYLAVTAHRRFVCRRTYQGAYKPGKNTDPASGPCGLASSVLHSPTLPLSKENAMPTAPNRPPRRRHRLPLRIASLFVILAVPLLASLSTAHAGAPPNRLDNNGGGV